MSQQRLSPVDAEVEPHQFIGWLGAQLDTKGSITIDEWNRAVKALTGTRKDQS